MSIPDNYRGAVDSRWLFESLNQAIRFLHILRSKMVFICCIFHRLWTIDHRHKLPVNKLITKMFPKIIPFTISRFVIRN